MTDRIEKHVTLKASLARVWRALTDHAEFGTWFRVALDRPFAVGVTVRGHVTYAGWEHIRVAMTPTAIEPMTRFAYTWHPYPVDPSRDYAEEPETLVEFLLAETAEGIRLTVVEKGFERLPADRRDEAFRMNDGGWATQMENIAAHVA